jgi:hypothetical protein
MADHHPPFALRADSDYTAFHRRGPFGAAEDNRGMGFRRFTHRAVRQPPYSGNSSRFLANRATFTGTIRIVARKMTLLFQNKTLLSYYDA